MTEEMIAGAQPWFPEEDRAAILQDVAAALASGELAHGRHVRAFEAACADMAGTRCAVAVNSGAAALTLTWEALDLAGAEVVTPTETFAATALSILRAGATPVFADIDPRTLALTPQTISQVLTERTRAVALVHMFGLMSPDIPALRAFCAERGLILVEDAAHAHGAVAADGTRAGGLGRAGCFSYYATKILTTGEGGVVTTDDAALARRIARLRDHGRWPGDPLITAAGGNYRLGEIPAILGVRQHRRLDEIIARRRRLAAVYAETLCGAPGLTAIDPAPRDGHVYWRYAALLADGLDRDGLRDHMAQVHRARVTWMYEPLCHEQPLLAAARRGPTPGAESVRGRLINLPTHPAVSEADARRIAEGVRAWLETAA